MANVFISYNRQSESIVRTLVSDIESLNNKVWFDQKLSGGKVWWEQILTEIRNCDVFVFVLTPESLDSEACKREYNYADALGKPILPILVADGVQINLLPPVLSQIQYVDYRQQDRSSAFRLAGAFVALPAPQPLPNLLPTPPQAPISYLGSLTDRIETTDILSYKDQSSLLLDLKRGLNEPETTNGARTLLKKFRKRRDLFAVIAEEIDKLLVGETRRNTSNYPTLKWILLFIPILLGLGFSIYSISNQAPNGLIVDPTPPVQTDSQCDLQESEQNSERFSAGEQTFFPYDENTDRDLGIENFISQNYIKAEKNFREAIKKTPNDPESWIFMNNAKARELGCPLTVALVVPITNKESAALEMMRGVADAQEKYNKDKGEGDRLLQILIVDDGNETEISKKVAKDIVSEPAIIAVIGHNSSNATSAALPIYAVAGMSIISPTSTSTDLKSSVFFRTASSNSAMSEELGKYAQDTLNSKKIVVFYTEKSKYSENLLARFKSSISSAKITETIKLKKIYFDIEKIVEDSIKDQIDTVILFPSVAEEYVASAIDVAKEFTRKNNELSQQEKIGLLAGDSLFNPNTLIKGGESVKDMIVTVPLAPSPSYETIARHWGGTVNWRSTSSFDATTAITQAIDDLNPSNEINRQNILKQLPLIKVTSTEQPWGFKNGERDPNNPCLAQVTKKSEEAPGPQKSEFGFKKCI